MTYTTTVKRINTAADIGTDDCFICMDSYKIGQRTFHHTYHNLEEGTVADHRFHRDCAARYIKQTQKCPHDMQPVSPSVLYTQEEQDEARADLDKVRSYLPLIGAVVVGGLAVAAQVTGVAVAAGVAGVLGAAAAAAIGPLTVEEEISSGRLQVSEATALKAKTAAGAWAAVTGAVIGAHATSTFTAGIVETGAAAAVKTVGAIVLGTGVAVGIVGIASIAVGALLLPLIIRNANN